MAVVLVPLLAAVPASAHTSAAFGPPGDCTADQNHVHVGLGVFQLSDSCASAFVLTPAKGISLYFGETAPPCPNDGHVHVFVGWLDLFSTCVSA